MPRPVGRPTLYTPDLAAEICARIARGGTIRRVCADLEAVEGPDEQTVWTWMRRWPEFQASYREAVKARADYWAEEVVEIGDDARFDYGHSAAVPRAKLRIDTRMRLMAQANPARYGDKAQIEVTGAGGGPLRSIAASVVLKPEDQEQLRRIAHRALLGTGDEPEGEEGGAS